jgi:hypothetical protein
VSHQNKTQLCWDCQNAYGDRCEWMHDGTPVKGWDAEDVPEIRAKTYHQPATYWIKTCPNFVPDAPDVERPDFSAWSALKQIETELKK